MGRPPQETRAQTARRHMVQLSGAELVLSLQLSETWDDHHPAGKGTVCAPREHHVRRMEANCSLPNPTTLDPALWPLPNV
jgi:hypothetical protein